MELPRYTIDRVDVCWPRKDPYGTRVVNKLVIAGSRDVTMSLDQLDEIIKDHVPGTPTEVISGHANGMDKLGEAWAKKRGIPVRLFIPNWKLLGRRAGLSRNTEMAKAADFVIVVHNGSNGSLHMVRECKKLDVPCVSIHVSIA